MSRAPSCSTDQSLYLLDTNVLLELRKVRSSRADPQVAAWADTVAASDLLVSVVSLHEIAIGVALKERSDPDQGRILRRWLEGQVLTAFEGRTLAIDMAVALRAATLHVPDPAPIRDAFIAATALPHRLTVVTRNVRNFIGLGVTVLDRFASTQMD